MYIAGTFQPPPEDVQVVDARLLVVQGKVEVEEEADKAASTVSAFARHTPQVRCSEVSLGKRAGEDRGGHWHTGVAGQV